MADELVDGTLGNIHLLTEKQHEARAILGGSNRHACLVGGSRSGKTTLITRALVLRAIKYQSRHAILRFRGNAVWPSIGLDTFPSVMKRFFPSVRYERHQSMGYYSIFRDDGTQSEVWLGGLDEKERVEKILGNEYSTIFFNECSQLPYSSVLLALTRLAQVVPGLKQRAFYDLNPPGRSHWTNKLFGAKSDPVTDRPLPPEIAVQYQRLFLPMMANAANLSPEYLLEAQNLPEKQRLRFFEGLYVDETENALWTLELLERCRRLPQELPRLVRIVIAVDPSGAESDLDIGHDPIGIVAAGIGDDGHVYVLDDWTLLAGPNQWARRAVELYRHHRADRIVAEDNFGGAMVEATIRTVDNSVPYKKVVASRSKVVRAEPVSALYVSGKVHHVEDPTKPFKFKSLENELCQFTDLGYVGERSPNRADALVWAVTELALGENSQGWVEFYGRRAKALTGQERPASAVSVEVGTSLVPKSAIKAAEVAVSVALQAPSPYANFMFGSGVRYTADDKGIVRDVPPEHLEPLLKAGCRKLELVTA